MLRVCQLLRLRLLLRVLLRVSGATPAPAGVRGERGL